MNELYKMKVLEFSAEQSYNVLSMKNIEILLKYCISSFTFRDIYALWKSPKAGHRWVERQTKIWKKNQNVISI